LELSTKRELIAMSYDRQQADIEPDTSRISTVGGVQVIQDFPPNIDSIRAALTPDESAVFTYGPVIYAPKGIDWHDVPLIAHEKVHMRQQGQAPAHWWDRYLVDANFRLWQEVEAYHRQYMVAKRRLHPKLRQAYLQVLAGFLSSAMYGSIVSPSKAEQLVAKGHV
jgi:hypothetical protein